MTSVSIGASSSEEGKIHLREDTENISISEIFLQMDKVNLIRDYCTRMQILSLIKDKPGPTYDSDSSSTLDFPRKLEVAGNPSPFGVESLTAGVKEPSRRSPELFVHNNGTNSVSPPMGFPHMMPQTSPPSRKKDYDSSRLDSDDTDTDEEENRRSNIDEMHRSLGKTVPQQYNPHYHPMLNDHVFAPPFAPPFSVHPFLAPPHPLATSIFQNSLVGTCSMPQQQTQKSLLDEDTLTKANKRPRRGEKKPIPDEQKDQKYFDRRKRNNLAAKKSRDIKKSRDEEIAKRAIELENENMHKKVQLLHLNMVLAQTMLNIKGGGSMAVDSSSLSQNHLPPP